MMMANEEGKNGIGEITGAKISAVTWFSTERNKTVNIGY
jgi:hypothetical protein